MTDRVLRWLSTIALVLLALDAAWFIGMLSPFAVQLSQVARWGPAYLLVYLLLQATAAAVCEVAGVATLVVSLQRKQWGWFVGALLCLVVHFYASLALTFPGGFELLYRLAGSAYRASIYVTLYYALALTPITVLALVYAWTRRQPASEAAAVGQSPADRL